MSDIVSLFFLQYLVHVHEIGKHIQLKERTNMASMELIAARAGVSRGTVDRVLPAMILTGTVLGGTAHGIRFQIKNLYTC